MKIVYEIDVKQSRRYRHLVLAIRSEDGRDLVEELFIKRKVEVVSKSDSDILSKLKSEAKIVDDRVLIKGNISFDILRLIGGSGNLLCCGKTLVVSFFKKEKLLLKMSLVDGNFFSIDPAIFDNDKIILLSTCSLVVADWPPWIIYRLSLKFFDNDVDPQWILYQKSMITKEEARCFWRRYKDKYEDVKFDIFVDDRTRFFLEAPRELVPVLVLKDFNAIIADFAVDYEKSQRVFPNDFFERYKGILRDFSREKDFENDLIESGYEKKCCGDCEYYFKGEVVEETLSLLLDVGWNIEIFGRRVVPIQFSATIDGVGGDDIVVNCVVECEGNLINLEKITKSNGKFVEIANGVVALKSKKLTSLIDCVENNADAICKDSIRIAKNKIHSLSKMLIDDDVCCRNDFVKSIKEFFGDSKNFPKIPCEKNFRGELFSYQRQGLSWMNFLHKLSLGGILADDMGLGKSVQVIAFVSTFPKSSKILIIVPASLTSQWKLEFEKFLPSINVTIYSGKNRSEETLLGKGVVICSYSILRIDREVFSSYVFDAIVLDESQSIKNPKTQIAQALYSLKGNVKLSLSGTPIENSAMDLWAQFRFLIPGLLKSYSKYKKSFKNDGVDCVNNVKDLIKPFVLRRTKSDVAVDLPEKFEQEILVDMNDDQKGVYESYCCDFHAESMKNMEILEYLLRLRQICCHNDLVSGVANIEKHFVAEKFLKVLADIKEVVAENRKVLLYSQFSTMLRIFACEFNAIGIRYELLDGKTVNREKVVKNFCDDGKIPVFLISLKAGGVGLNLTVADFVFIYDPWWNFAAEQQAIDRAHRIGRQNKVIARRYITKNSIEEKIVAIKELKKSVFENIFDDKTSQLFDFSLISNYILK